MGTQQRIVQMGVVEIGGMRRGDIQARAQVDVHGRRQTPTGLTKGLLIRINRHRNNSHDYFNRTAVNLPPNCRLFSPASYKSIRQVLIEACLGPQLDDAPTDPGLLVITFEAAMAACDHFDLTVTVRGRRHTVPSRAKTRERYRKKGQCQLWSSTTVETNSQFNRNSQRDGNTKAQMRAVVLKGTGDRPIFRFPKSCFQSDLSLQHEGTFTRDPGDLRLLPSFRQLLSEMMSSCIREAGLNAGDYINKLAFCSTSKSGQTAAPGRPPTFDLVIFPGP